MISTTTEQYLSYLFIVNKHKHTKKQKNYIYIYIYNKTNVFLFISSVVYICYSDVQFWFCFFYDRRCTIQNKNNMNTLSPAQQADNYFRVCMFDTEPLYTHTPVYGPQNNPVVIQSTYEQKRNTEPRFRNWIELKAYCRRLDTSNTQPSPGGTALQHNLELHDSFCDEFYDILFSYVAVMQSRRLEFRFIAQTGWGVYSRQSLRGTPVCSPTLYSLVELRGFLTPVTNQHAAGWLRCNSRWGSSIAQFDTPSGGRVSFLVCGSVSLLNAACQRCANLVPCRFKHTIHRQATDDWVTASLAVPSIAKGVELTVWYTEGCELVYPCQSCARNTST
jgi:hypothetical protein